MPANVVEAAQLAVVPADKKQRLTQQLRCKVVPGIGHLAGVSHHLPCPPEDLFLLLSEHVRIGVEPCGKRPRLPDLRRDFECISGNVHTFMHRAGTFYGNHGAAQRSPVGHISRLLLAVGIFSEDLQSKELVGSPQDLLLPSFLIGTRSVSD